MHNLRRDFDLLNSQLNSWTTTLANREAAAAEESNKTGAHVVIKDDSDPSAPFRSTLSQLVVRLREERQPASDLIAALQTIGRVAKTAQPATVRPLLDAAAEIAKRS